MKTAKIHRFLLINQKIPAREFIMNTNLSEIEQTYRNIFEAASDGIIITELETGKILAANPAIAEIHGYTREALTGLRMQRLIHAKSLPFFAAFANVIQQGGLFEMLAQHVKWDDSIISVEWHASAFRYQDRPCALAILRDVSKRVQAEHQLQQRVGIRAKEQSILLDISQTLASTLELEPGLILNQIKVLIPYTRACLFSLEESSLVTLAVHDNEQIEQVAPFRIQLNGDKTRNILFNEHKSIRIANIKSNEPSALFLRSLLQGDSAALLEGILSWMWVPLAVKDRVVGGIGIAHTEQNVFTAHHANLAMTIANQAAVTLANAELYEHAQALAALQERQRLAQNLHDAVNQSLFSAGLIAEVLPRLWERDPAKARQSLEDLRRLTRGAQAEMRALLAELLPTTLTDTELGDLLILLGNAFTGRTNIPVDVTAVDEGSLPAETQVALYRICQEALNNIAKHAKASRVEIDLHHASGELKLLIRDNGRGFGTSTLTPSGHYGLAMMRERAEAVGAELTITSPPGKGVEVKVGWAKKES
ncbi:MAG: PAS domain S-box protein [Bacteroidetes bacterium]|nr:PAS domain S-box protein [Bacteroidota bacterium]